MNSTLKNILEAFESMKGQHVITESHTIERLIAIGADKHDYYWILYDGRKCTWHSCVSGLIRLKGFIQEKDYKKLIISAELNHFDQVIKENEKKDKICHVAEHDEIVSDFCWDLN